MGRAGKGVRLLALRRRVNAVQAFVVAGVLIFAPIGIMLFLSALSLPTTLPLYVYVLFPLLGLSTIPRGLYLWKRANHADQGAAGEEAIEKLLMPLKRRGWHLEYGIRHRAVGDVDVFLISPNRKAFTLDVKSHRGCVVSDGEKLYRLRGKTKSAFEKDFLAQAKKQAITMKQYKKLEFVSPCIVFSAAQVHLQKRKVNGVYVMDKTTLVSSLQKLG
ncbi:MAG: nuclease-related domain-containing protein [Cyanobacteria bacterium P01_E01_bin.6]